MVKISVVINTLNEEKNLRRALVSVKTLADEIIVVDMHSIDNTAEIARSMGAKVFEYEAKGYVEPARNYAILKAEFEWVFILDADEEIGPKLIERIKKLTEKSGADYFRLPRKNIVFGKWIKHSRWWPDYNIRLFRKGFVTWNEIIHSVPLTKGTGVDLAESEDNAITHHHYTSIEQYIDRLNRYTTLHAKNKVADGIVFHWSNLITQPSNEFLSRFFFGEGYKDGIHGLALSGLQAFSEFVTYLKIWRLTGKTHKPEKFTLKDIISTMKKISKDFNYWQADSLYKKYGGMVNLLKRKFKLS